MQFYDYTIYIDYGTFNFGICKSKEINELFYDNPDFYRIKRIISQNEDKESILSAHNIFGKLTERARKYYYDTEKRIAFIPFSKKDVENATSKFMKCAERMPLTKFSISGIAGVTIRYLPKSLFIGMDRLFSITGPPLMLDELFRCRCHAINDAEYNSWKDRVYHFIQNLSTETIQLPSRNTFTIDYKKELDIFFYEFEKIITSLQDIEIEDASIMSPSKYFNIE